jgi:hypothetical protein
MRLDTRLSCAAIPIQSGEASSDIRTLAQASHPQSAALSPSQNLSHKHADVCPLCAPPKCPLTPVLCDDIHRIEPGLQ